MNDQNLSPSSKIEQFSPILSVFLNELQDKSPEILEKIQKKINSVNPSLFRKKNIQECIHQINTNFDSLSKVSRVKNDFSFDSKQCQFLIVFVCSCYEVIYQKKLQELEENDFSTLKKLLPWVTDFELNKYIFSNMKNSRDLWDEKSDNTLLSIMKEKYPLLFDSNIHDQKLRIKWKDVCIKFKEIYSKGEYRGILGKHCRERWINHLNPNMKKGEWTPNEDMNLLINVLKYKKRWCLVAKELNNRSQHSLKNRFFHLISINLNITNKSCLKRKNLNSDIVKILAKKHNYHLPIESSLTKNLKKMKNFPKIKKNHEENLTKIKNFEDSSEISPEKTLLLDKIKNKEEIFEKIEEQSLKTENNGFQSNLINQNNNGYTPFFHNPFFLNQQIQAFYTHNLIQNQYIANYQNFFMNPFNRLNWKN